MAALAGSDLIVHAGDIGAIEVIQQLGSVAPVHAIRGNVDKADWAAQFADDDVVEVGGKRIYVVHRLQDLAFDPVEAGFHVIVSGHSHRPGSRWENEVLYINPGSAGPRRFSLPVAVGRLDISGDAIHAEIVELDV